MNNVISTAGGYAASSFEAPLLSSFSLEELCDPVKSIYGLGPDWRLSYISPGWIAFARENSAPERLCSEDVIGTALFSLVPDILRPYYQQLYHSCLNGNHSAEHLYDCSSAFTYRRLRMEIRPFPQRAGLLVVNTIVEEHGAVFESVSADAIAAYLTQDSLLQQCANCRRVRHQQDGEWHWVRDWVKQSPPKTSHTLCASCAIYYEIDAHESD